MSKLVPYLCCKDAAAAIDFYKKALDAEEQFRLTGDDGKIGHATLTIGDDTLYLSDEWPEGNVFSPQTLGGSGVSLHLEVDDVDAAFQRAVGSGATSLREPADQFYGDRNATVSDPFGHRWMLSMRKEQVSDEEMRRRAEGAGYSTA
jgi:PhnB protein